MVVRWNLTSNREFLYRYPLVLKTLANRFAHRSADFVRDTLGADEVVDYTKQNVRDEVRKFKPDAVIDDVGGTEGIGLSKRYVTIVYVNEWAKGWYSNVDTTWRSIWEPRHLAVYVRLCSGHLLTFEGATKREEQQWVAL